MKYKSYKNFENNKGENMLAPILVTVYNRKEHLKKSIQALQNNLESKDSVLYVASDAAYKEADLEIIDEIREYVKQIKGFKKVILLKREKNIGSYKSVKLAIEDILVKHGKIIFLEDDIIVSKFFLKFMNESLETYKFNKDIFSICSYIPPNFKLLNQKEDVYLWNYYCPWGVATWKDRWDRLDLNLNDYENSFKNKKELITFFQGANHALAVLFSDREKLITAMDARIDWNIFKNNWFVVYPQKTLSKNIGVDGSGEHSGNNKIFSEQILEEFNPRLSKNLTIDKKINNERKKYHKFVFYRRMYIYLKIFKLDYILEKLKIISFIKNTRDFFKGNL